VPVFVSRGCGAVNNVNDFDRLGKEMRERHETESREQVRKAAWGFLYLFGFATLFLLVVLPTLFYLLLLAWRAVMG